MAAWNELSSEDKVKRHGSLVTITGTSTVGDDGSGAYYDNGGVLVPLIDKGYASPVSHTVVHKSVPIGHGDTNEWDLVCIQLNIDTVKVTGRKFSVLIGEIGSYLVSNNILQSVSAYDTGSGFASTNAKCAFYGVNDTINDAIGNGTSYDGQGVLNVWYLPNRLTAIYYMSSFTTPYQKEPDWCVANHDKIVTFTVTATNSATINNNASYPFVFSNSYFHLFNDSNGYAHYCILNGYLSIDTSGYNVSAQIKCAALDMPYSLDILPSDYKYFYPSSLTDGTGTRYQGRYLFNLHFEDSHSVTPFSIHTDASGSSQVNMVYKWSAGTKKLELTTASTASGPYGSRPSIEINSPVFTRFLA
jgi:hypothetical protein